jgi:DhnA family fructose-bisphosphate aldolase class Ia
MQDRSTRYPVAPGRAARLARLMPDGRAVVVPVDDALISGPQAQLHDVMMKVTQAADGGANGVLSFSGLLRKIATAYPRLPRVANVTASTTRSVHTRKVLVDSVQACLENAFDAVAVHVNVSSQYESEMLSNLGKIQRDCEQLQMPLVAIIYPRRERDGKDDNYLELKEAGSTEYRDLVAHCVRIAADLGADIIKTQFTGSIESFRYVVEAAYNVPIWIAGGPRLSTADALRMASDAVQAGASGVCYGRNSYLRNNTAAFVRCLARIVHDGVKYDPSAAEFLIDEEVAMSSGPALASHS